jgi:6-phosphogluconolactonase (cycloisomerase 2 family)
MSATGKFWLSRMAVVLVGVCVLSGVAAAGDGGFVITNDDSPTGNLQFNTNSVSFYSIGANGLLTLQQTVFTSGYGIAGGYFGANRLAVLNGGGQQCVYASDAATGDIAGIVVSTFTLGGSAVGSANDTGVSNGIGLATNSQYLYASFTDSSNIGTFQIQSNCNLTFIGDVTVTGLQGGFVDAMAAQGNLLVVTYGDGSIESFNISGVTPVSNGDKQNSTQALSSLGATYPSAVLITQDGHYALFGDTATAAYVEVSDVSSGKLTATVPYRSGATISSSNILLSPDESMLYVSDTQGDRVSAAFFDKNTGKITPACDSNLLKGYSSNFSYLGGLAVASGTGTGGGVYVGEYGAPAIAMIQVTVKNGKCTMKEAPGSPITDPNGSGLISIGNFMP